MFGLNDIINIATCVVLFKFPNIKQDFYKNKFIAFELIEMLCSELEIKHSNLFFNNYIKDFVEVKNFLKDGGEL